MKNIHSLIVIENIHSLNHKEIINFLKEGRINYIVLL